MKRFFKIFIILFILTIFYLYIANLCLMPKSITLLQGEKLKLATLWGVSLTQPNKDIYDDKQNIETLQTSSNIGGERISDVRKYRYACKFIWNNKCFKHRC